MRVLVTGANGFVGREVVRRLLRGGHDVAALDPAGNPAPGVTAIAGDLSNAATRRLALAGCDAVVHLATIPGGAAEANPARAWHVNVEATAALMQDAAEANGAMRFVFASSIAVLGSDLPALIDDSTASRPSMLYGAHKAMMETWLATLTRRGAFQGLSLRLPGIIARPQNGEGFKSAFLSDIFHAACAGSRFTMPVSGAATTWLMSVGQAAANFLHAVEAPWDPCEPYGATLPAVHTRIDTLVGEIARQAGCAEDWIDYSPDTALEASFGRLPPLAPVLSERLGFAADASLASLVADTFVQISEDRA